MQKSHNSQQDLQSFSQNSSFFKRRIGTLTLYETQNTPSIDKLILFIEYFQLISQIFVICCDDYTNKTPETDSALDKKYIFEIITYFFKLINPSFLINFTESNGITASILCLVFAFSLFKILLFGYITYVAYYKKDKGRNSFLIALWRWIWKLQTRNFCFFITSFWVKSLLGLENQGFNLFGMRRPICIVLYCCLIAIEYIFSIYLKTQFYYRLPTKKFLSSKSFDLQLSTLIHKLALQIIQISFKTNSLTCRWAFTSINLLFCLFKNRIFYGKLPLYHFKALLSQSDLMSIVNSFSVACFFQTLLKAANYQEFDSNFPLIFGILLSILIAKVSRGYINQVILNLLTKNSKNYSPNLLVHKICLIKQLERKLEKPGKRNPKFDWVSLIAATEHSRLNYIFNIEEENHQTQNHQNDRNSIFLNFLENLSKKFPKSSLVKLHIAKLCAKKPELYARAIKISADLAKNSWSKNYITFLFLLDKIQKSITQASMTSNTKLDLYTYVKSQLFFEELKNEISQQTQLTIDLCSNIMKEVTEIGTIFNHAQEIHKYRMKVQKKMLDISCKLPEHFIAPLKLCADYHLVLNFSFHDSQKYIDLYTNKYFKCEKYFKAPNLIQENLYQNTNSFLLLSGQKLDNGQILFCTKSLEDLCGTKKTSLCGSHVSTLFTSSLQAYFAEIFKQLFENGKASLLNQTTRAYFNHKNGHIIEAEFYLRIHPYITENLYLNMLIRPIPSEHEYLLLRENGDIEGATKNISKKLGLNLSSKSPSVININALSSELARVNEAFNFIERQPSLINPADLTEPSLFKVESAPASATRKRNYSGQSKSLHLISHVRALEIQALYRSEPQKVRISPLKAKKIQISNGSSIAGFKLSEDYIYDCKVSVLQYGPASIKLISLYERFFGHEKDEDQHISDLHSPRRILPSPKKSSATPLQKILEQNQSFSSMVDASENIEECTEVKFDERLVTEWRGQTQMTTEGNLLSPRTDRSQANLLSPRTENRISLFPNGNHPPPPLSHTVFTELDEAAPTPRNIKIKKLQSQKSDNPLSQTTLTETKFHRAFQQAINARTYPKLFNALYLVFYVIIFSTFCSQIALKVLSDITYNNLAVKKDLLVCAQLQTFYIIRIQTSCRGASLQVYGTLTAQQTGNPFSVSELIELTQYWVTKLSNANEKIISSANYLDSEAKEELFKKDIDVVGSYFNIKDKSTTKMTTFQAIDQIKATLQRLYHMSSDDINSSAGYALLRYIALNTLNDIIAKNLDITNLFIDSVQREREYLQLTMILCITLIPTLLAVIVIMLIYIIWKQYVVEKNLMLAFVKLHPQGIKTLFNTLSKFQKRLTDEEKFEDKSALHLVIVPGGDEQDSRMSIYHKKQSTHLVKYSQIQKKYWGYTAKVLFYIIILTGIIICNYVSAQKSANIIYKRQDQLQFANWVSVTASLSYISYTELFISNNTNLVNHMLPMKSLTTTLKQLDTIQNQLETVFLEGDNNYDPEIKHLLFGNSTCSKLTGLLQEYCQNLQDAGLYTGLNYAISLFRYYLKGKPDQYENVDKTSLTHIVAVGLENFDLLVWSSGTGSGDAQVIANLINKKLQNNISDASFQRILILIVFIISLMVVSVLIWRQILVKLSDVNNDFKRVLQVFPPDFVLSSFLLKNFLMETSQGIQNF